MRYRCFENYLLKQPDKKYFKSFEFQNSGEEQRLFYKIMDSIYCKNFRKYYVIPEFKKFLKKYEDNEKGIYKFLKYLKWYFIVDDNKEIGENSSSYNDAMLIAENLDIAYFIYLEDIFDAGIIEKILLRKDICEFYNKKVKVNILKEKDFDFLVSIGLIDALRDYLNKMREFVRVNESVESNI